jgi:hypothetical protein
VELVGHDHCLNSIAFQRLSQSSGKGKECQWNILGVPVVTVGFVYGFLSRIPPLYVRQPFHRGVKIGLKTPMHGVAIT